MDSVIQLILLVLATVAFPMGYALVCRRMNASAIPRPPRLAFFFLFGTLGGWALAYLLSPSGLAALCTLAMVTAAPLALLISSILLARQAERTRFHRFAMWAGFAYCGLLLLGVLAGGLYH